MHRRLTLILLIAGIVASLGVANAYFSRGAYNDGFSAEGPSPRDRTIIVAKSREAAARAAAARTFKGGRQSARDWSDMLGRYAPWMADFEINAVNDAAGKNGVDVASVVRQSARSGKRHVPSDVSGLGDGPSQGVGSDGQFGSSSSLGSYGTPGGRRAARSPVMPVPTYSPASDTDVSAVPYETVLAENSYGQEGAQDLAELSDPRTRYLDVPTTGNDNEIPYVQPGTDTTTNPEVPTDDSPVPNPEPGTLALGAMGLAALASRMRRLRAGA